MSDSDVEYVETTRSGSIEVVRSRTRKEEFADKLREQQTLESQRGGSSKIIPSKDSIVPEVARKAVRASYYKRRVNGIQISPSKYSIHSDSASPLTQRTLPRWSLDESISPDLTRFRRHAGPRPIARKRSPPTPVDRTIKRVCATPVPNKNIQPLPSGLVPVFSIPDPIRAVCDELIKAACEIQNVEDPNCESPLERRILLFSLPWSRFKRELSAALSNSEDSWPKVIHTIDFVIEVLRLGVPDDPFVGCRVDGHASLETTIRKVDWLINTYNTLPTSPAAHIRQKFQVYSPLYKPTKKHRRLEHGHIDSVRFR